MIPIFTSALKYTRKMLLWGCLRLLSPQMKHCNLNASLNQSSRLYLNTYHYSPWIAYVYLTYNLMSIVLYGWNDMVGTLWRCGQQVVVGIVGCFNNRSPFPPSLRKETAFFIMWWKEQIVHLHMHKMYIQNQQYVRWFILQYET